MNRKTGTLEPWPRRFMASTLPFFLTMCHARACEPFSESYSLPATNGWGRKDFGSLILEARTASYARNPDKFRLPKKVQSSVDYNKVLS